MSNINQNDALINEQELDSTSISIPGSALEATEAITSETDQNPDLNSTNFNSNTESIDQIANEESNDNLALDLEGKKISLSDKVEKETTATKGSEANRLTEQRRVIEGFFYKALLNILNKYPALYLERFGIVFNRAEMNNASDEAQALKYSPNQLRLEFEKCNELTTVQRQRFPNLAEIREISQEIRAISPGTVISERELRHQIRCIIQDIRDQTVVNGYSEEIENFGRFYSIHNRQGSAISEWYAGADIFLVSNQPSQISNIQATQQQTLQVYPSTWDLAQQLYGRPVKIFSVNLKYELAELGLDPAEFPKNSEPTIRIAVFKTLHSTTERPVFHYWSDGLRSLSTDSSGIGSECIFQLIGGVDPNDQDSFDVPTYTSRAIAMAWILLQGTKHKVIQGVSAMSTELPLFALSHLGQTLHTSVSSTMNSILISANQELPLIYQAKDKHFKLHNIVGLYEDEAALLASDKKLLLQLLKRRGLDRITNPARPSLLLRSSYATNHSDQQTKITKDAKIDNLDNQVEAA